MIVLQVVPRAGVDAYKLLRHKVTHEAKTWSWTNRRKTRLRHHRVKAGHIDVSSADGVLVAQIRPADPAELFFLAEKFIGRLIAWFEEDLQAINLQFRAPGAARPRKRGR